MPLSGVVVLFFPDENELIRNIQSYINYLDLLYIIDNSTGDVGYENRLKEFSIPVIYVRNSKNIGIAAALNTAVTLAHQNGYEWMLTMDQDSYFEEVEISSFIELFNSDFKDKKELAILSPQTEGYGNGTSKKTFHSVITTITSGSLLNLNISRELGGFDEKLFIDEVDFDYCYRCILAGYKIFQLDNVYLNHRLGNNIKSGYFSIIKRSNRIIHNPTRVYYMVRNHFYMVSRYGKLFPETFKKRKIDLLTTLKNNLLFSGNFFKVLKSAVRGYIHFLQKK
jgi:rhamnosyltransferase